MKRIEDVLTFALQLNRNIGDTTVHLKGRVAFVVNSDRTVLAKISGLVEAYDEVGFVTTDFEGDSYRALKDRVTFVQRSGRFMREKTCSTPDLKFGDVEEAFERLVGEDEGKVTVRMESGVCKVLNQDLSHVELWAEQTGFRLLQRDMYSGSVIRITEARAEGPSVSLFDLKSVEGVPKGRSVKVALRTKDLIGLLMASPNSVYSLGEKFCVVRDCDSGEFVAVISSCVYDNIFIDTTIEETEDERRRKEPKERKGEQEADRQFDGSKGRDSSGGEGEADDDSKALSGRDPGGSREEKEKGAFVDGSRGLL